MHTAKWALIVCIPLLTVACTAGLRDYVQPGDNGSANIFVFNDSTKRLGLHIYENAKDCSQKRKVIYIEPHTEYKFSARSSIPTAYSMSVETGKSVSTGYKIMTVSTEYCRSMFSFIPDPQGDYRVTYHDVSSECDVKATKSTAGGQVPVELTRRTFHRPLKEDGSFCFPL